MKNILLLFIPVFLFSCSSQKRIARFLKKESPKEVAVYIAVHYPEYLRSDTIIFHDTIIKEVEVIVPEIVHDTFFSTDTILDGIKNFNFEDSHLQIKITTENGKGKLWYKIKERSVKDTVRVEIFVEKPCPPCPSETIIREVVKQNEIALAEQKGKLSFFRNGFWILLCIILALVGWKFLKVAGKM